MKLADSTEIIRHLETRHPSPGSTRRSACARDGTDESRTGPTNRSTGTWSTNDGRSPSSSRVCRGCVYPVPAAVRPMVKLLFARQTRYQLRGQGLGRLGVGEQREKFRSAMDWLDSMVDGQFLCGGELSVADVAVAAQVERSIFRLPRSPRRRFMRTPR